MNQLANWQSTFLWIGSALIGSVLVQFPVNAQTPPKLETVGSSVRTDLICMTRRGADSPTLSRGIPRGQTESRIKVPASKLKKLKEAGFEVSSCASSGDSFAVAGLTLCQMAARGDTDFNAAFFRAHKVSLEQVCRYADPE